MRRPDAVRPLWLNGERVSPETAGIPLTDEGVLAGLGLFETIALRGGRTLDLAPHLERMAAGARRLGLDLPPARDLSKVVARAAEEEPSDCAWIKIVVTRGGRWAVFSGAMEPAEEGRSIAAVLLPWRRSLADPLAGIKALSYAQNVLGLEEARRRGADEGIWLNGRGRLAEGCASNLFVLRGRRLSSPAEAEGILPGVVRAITLRAARDLGLAVHVGKVRVVTLREAREAFMTSSLTGIRPLVRFEGRPVGGGGPGPVTRALAAGVAKIREAG